MKFRMIYGRICYELWLALPTGISFDTSFGKHLLTWAGYWAHMKEVKK